MVVAPSFDRSCSTFVTHDVVDLKRRMKIVTVPCDSQEIMPPLSVPQAEAFLAQIMVGAAAEARARTKGKDRQT